MRTTVFPPHRQGVEHDRGEHTDCSRLEEDVACGNRESAFAMTRPQRGSQNQRVQMTAMICREHERTVCRQFLPARDSEPVSDSKINPQRGKASLLGHALEQTALAPHTAKPLGRSEPGITRWLELPRFHSHPPPEKIRCGCPAVRSTK